MLQTTPQIEDNVLEATKKMLETELLPTIQNETASRMDDLESVLVTQNIEKDEEIQNLKDKINALEANQNTSKVIFSGVRKNHMTINSNVRIEVDITFDEAIANIGQGLDIDTGIFKCPVSGIYTFSFGALSDLSGFMTFVGVYKNGTFHFWIHENGNGHASYVNLSHVWTMVLQKDDTVQLKLVGGGGEDKHYKGLHSQSIYPVWFNGQLLMQQ